MRGVAIVGLVVLAGCGKVSGVDDYSVGTSKEVPYLGGSECQACLDQNCAPQLQACASTELCSKVLACRQKCTDPDCHFHCRYDNGDFDAAWDGGRQPLPADDGVRKCARDSCRAACRIGESWGCVGRYSWKQPPAGDLTIRHLAFVAKQGTGIAGAGVRVCASYDTDCASPLADGVTIEDGTVELPVGPLHDHELHLRIDDPAYKTFLVFGPDRPRWPHEYTLYGMAPWATIAPYFAASTPYDPAVGYAMAEIFDCANFGAEGLQLELDVVDTADGSLHPCPSCETVYTSDAYTPNLSGGATATTTSSPSVIFAFVPPGTVQVVARDPVHGVVARSSSQFRAVADRWATIGLLPVQAAE